MTHGQQLRGRPFKVVHQEAHENFTNLYYTYAQFFSNHEGHAPFRGVFNDEYVATDHALRLSICDPVVEERLQDAYRRKQNGELSQEEHKALTTDLLNRLHIEDWAQLERAIAQIKRLEALSMQKAREIRRGEKKDPFTYTLPEKQKLTEEDQAFIKAAKAKLEHDSVTVYGVTECYAETGTEGVYWAVYEEGKEYFEGLHLIDEGDRLTIYGDDEQVLFDGIIVYDRITGWRPYHPDRPFGMGQQGCIVYNVHWIQKGYTELGWGQLFITETPLRARLIQPPKPQRIH